MDDLDSIFIRARDKEGKWGSFSLRELLEMGVGGKEIGRWFMSKILQFCETEEGAVLTEKNAESMLGVLDMLGYRFFKLKRPLEKEITMAESKSFKHEREWPVILSVARRYGLDPQQTVVLLAMREAEAGGKGYEFGVKPAKGTDLKTQAEWAAGSIKANARRYNALMKEGVFKGSRRTVYHAQPPEEQGPYVVLDPKTDFIEFMGRFGGPTGLGWAPVDSPEMPAGEQKLNMNWVPNVQAITQKLNKRFEEKGAGVGID